MWDLMAISAKKMAYIENIEILYTTGEGHFSKVKLAWHVLTRGALAASY